VALQAKFSGTEIIPRSFLPDGEPDCERTQWGITDNAAPGWVTGRTLGITKLGQRSIKMNKQAIRYGE
jgi:hypothetical protein